MYQMVFQCLIKFNLLGTKFSLNDQCVHISKKKWYRNVFHK